MTSRTKPILVMMTYRGGERLSRCLRSITASQHHFHRVVLSVTASEDSDDMRQCREFQRDHSHVEVICTGKELPTMQHQAFWITYLQESGARPDDWIFWLAYDDEVFLPGIDALVDSDGAWPVTAGTAYFGPWAMRHEQPDALWSGDEKAPMEIWTSFPSEGPLRLPVVEWIRQQLLQPTYMQMSGSVNMFSSFIDLRDAKPTKTGPMRIEMATAASPGVDFVAEFSRPVAVIYGRSDSDRASYGQAARAEDLHLLRRLGRYSRHSAARVGALMRLGTALGAQSTRLRLSGGAPPVEEWRVRGSTAP